MCGGFDSYDLEYDPTRRELLLLPCGSGSGSSSTTWVMRWDDIRSPMESPLGAKWNFSLDLPGHGNQFYLTFLSEGAVPGIPIPGLPDLPLAPTRFFFRSLGFPGMVGVLDGSGKGGGGFQVPREPTLRGLYLHAAALVLDGRLLPTYVTGRRSTYFYW